jgi:hypothetical protein
MFFVATWFGSITNADVYAFPFPVVREFEIIGPNDRDKEIAHRMAEPSSPE